MVGNGDQPNWKLIRQLSVTWSGPSRPGWPAPTNLQFSGLAGLKLIAQLPFKEVSADDAERHLLPVLAGQWAPINLQSQQEICQT